MERTRQNKEAAEKRVKTVAAKVGSIISHDNIIFGLPIMSKKKGGGSISFEILCTNFLLLFSILWPTLAKGLGAKISKIGAHTWFSWNNGWPCIFVILDVFGIPFPE